MKSIFIIICLALVQFSSFGQTSTELAANYQLASRFSPKKLEKMIFSTSVDPHWLKNSDRFWYTYETTNGKNWYIVDPAKGQKRLMFDNEKLAAQLTAIVKDPMDAQHLMIDSLRFVRDENWIQFEVKSTEEIIKKDTATKKGATPARERKVYYFEYNLNSGQLVELGELKKPKRNPRWAAIAPDGQTIVFVKNYNLFWMDRSNYEKALLHEEDSTIVEHKITSDGMEYFSYGTEGFLGGTGENNVDKEKNKNKRKPAFIFWAPDSKHFAMVRTDARKVNELWVINSISDPRPTLETYKYWMPGEKESPLSNIYLFTNATKTYRELDIKQFRDQDITIWSARPPLNTRDDDWRPLVWLGNNNNFYFNRTSRDLKRIDLCSVDINSGNVSVLIPERLNTYIETRRPGLVNNGSELIHWSERDGWAHLYLYDGQGKLKNQITSGSYHVEDIVGVDDKKRVVYFIANGREANEDPYYTHLYRVNLDGTGLRLLNTGNFDHSTSLNDSRSYFVSTSSRVNSVPQSALYNVEGRKIMDLEKADFSSLMSA
ncbi:MAG: DPP IV N-terminal domain-containing protein, partial [Flavisolibacter sp.]|nr:DPP IV N-terminal domain-containing protein [Flavisolibacter sp.]